MTSTKRRVLVVDDEANLALGIAENLEMEGYYSDIAEDGEQALSKIRSGDWDLVVLDVMMPKKDGLTVCQELRAEDNNVPILFLTARGGLDDRLRGLEAGGDDYLPKPFSLRELLLRVAAIVRRRQSELKRVATTSEVSFGGNHVDFATYKGRAFDGEEHSLTHKEAMILKTLSEREGTIVSREEILEAVWGYEVFPSTRTIDNFIVRLRKRFENDHEHPAHQHTIRGVGYRFTLEPETN
ncbi:MAG: two-component system alkaline phosphatase synthesis response regulator PhoP [Candidatus Paceibacteria bacterium]|jgi:two-component system alkaline phosphatase synthesis response regulator PhoP